MKRWYFLLSLLFIFAYVYAGAVVEPITVTNISVVERSGLVQASFKNNSDKEQSFVYIMLVKDSNGYTAQLTWANKELKSHDSFTAGQSLTLEVGTYTVEVFVWSDITDPVPLSYSYSSFTFDFLDVTSFCKGIGACFEGKVTRIVDGDTLDVDGRRIRLALVDTPERNEAGYAEAKKFTSSLCTPGSTVLVDQDGKQMYDRYNRMIAVVYCDGALLNAELLYAEHAVILKGFCKQSEFGDEEWAKLFGC